MKVTQETQAITTFRSETRQEKSASCLIHGIHTRAGGANTDLLGLRLNSHWKNRVEYDGLQAERQTTLPCCLNWLALVCNPWKYNTSYHKRLASTRNL